MSGYTPVFNSIFDGTLCGKWPDSAVWLTMLALCDRHGEVNLSYAAICARTGWPADLLRQGIESLMTPDPDSQSPAEEGRRLVLIDPARSWGWRIVNHSRYREKARLQAKDARRTESGADAERKRRERMSPGVPRNPPVSPSPDYKHKQQTHEAKAVHNAHAREVLENPIHDWRRVGGIDAEAFRTWLAYLDQAQKRVSPATEVAMAKALAVTGDAQHQRDLIALHKERGWRNIRNVDLKAEFANRQTDAPRKTRYEQLIG